MPRGRRAGRALGLLAFAAFLGCVPLANWMIGTVGTVCVPNGPCLIPVAPGLMAPSGVVLVGLALVLRDLVQRCLGVVWGIVAILGGTRSPCWSPGASGARLRRRVPVLGELADLGVYTPLQRRGLVLAVIASSLVGLVVDSLVFLTLAFGSLDFLAGQVVGKAWAVLVSLPLIHAVRRLAPAPAR